VGDDLAYRHYDELLELPPFEEARDAPGQYDQVPGDLRELPQVHHPVDDGDSHGHDGELLELPYIAAPGDAYREHGQIPGDL